MRGNGGVSLSKTVIIRRSVRVALMTAMIGIVLILLYWASLSIGDEKVLPGVQLKGINLDLSRIGRDEGMAKLKLLEKDFMSQSVKINYRNKSQTVSLKEIEFKINAEGTMDTAFAVANNYNLLERLWYSIHPVTHAITLSVNIDKNKLENQLKTIIAENTILPKDARPSIIGQQKIAIIPGTPGRQADLDKLYNDLLNNLAEGKNGPVNLSFIQTQPHITTEKIRSMGINAVLGSYTTHFRTGQVNRAQNIAIGAKALNGLYVAPEEVFSFNKAVGPRSAEAGYKSAGVIVGDQFNEDLGGGICQVSTTLYNAVLKSNLGIEERHNHSLPITYVPLGQDAAVAYKFLDFKFKNTTEKYIYLDTRVSGGYITVNVLGNKDYLKTVKVSNRIYQVLEPNVIYEVDSSVPEGQTIVAKSGSRGYRVASTRQVLENGKLVKTEQLPSSYYLKVDRVIKVNSLIKKDDSSEEAPAEKNKTKAGSNANQEEENNVENNEL